MMKCHAMFAVALLLAGKYLYLVPYRAAYEPQNGQRGYGKFVRLDLNIFGVNGMTVLNLPETTRFQIPSFADINLRGYVGGFACKMALLWLC